MDNRFTIAMLVLGGLVALCGLAWVLGWAFQSGRGAWTRTRVRTLLDRIRKGSR